jgi:hypothetical protein
MKTQQILDNLRAKELKALAKSAGLPRTVTRTPEIVAELNRFLYTAPPGLAAKAACSAVAKPSSRVRSVPAKSPFSKAWAFSHSDARSNGLVVAQPSDDLGVRATVTFDANR